jgi:putative ABC transport system permease protein
MRTLLHDVRYAIRLLVRHRGVTLVALVTLSLAIGANAAIFSVYNALLIRALPFPQSNRLAQIGRQYSEEKADATSVPKFFQWRSDSGTVFTDIAGFDLIGSGFNLVGSGAPERLRGTRVTAGFLGVLGVAPALGRDFRPDEDVPGGARVVILSHGLWVRRFGANPGIIDAKITLNSEPYTVVGVMPDGFAFPSVDVWTLFQFDPASQDKANYFNVVGRLRPGVSFDQARAAMKVSLQRFAKDHKDSVGEHESVFVDPLQEFRNGSMRPALLVLLASVGFVLLIACVNVANLQIAQAAERRHEIALKAALGAGTATILRELLVESVLLALASAAAGLLVANWTLPMLLKLAPVNGPSLEGVTLDGTVLGVAMVVSTGCGILFGVLPAWQAAHPLLDTVLREGSGRLAGSQGRGRKVLVASEVALAMLLTVGAALLVKNLSRLYRVDPGFTAENVLTMKLSLSEVKYGKSAQPLSLFEEDVTSRLRRTPGTTAAGLALSLPLEQGPDLPFSIEGKYVPGTQTGIGDMQFRSVSAGYFDALGIKVRRGRPFTAHDRAGTLPVVIINEAAAKEYWPGVNALGRRLTIGEGWDASMADTSPREIVGIVDDVREQGLGREAPSVMYVPIGQVNDNMNALAVRLLPMNLVVRSTQPVGSLSKMVADIVQSVDPAQPVSDVRTMTEIVSRSLGSERFNTMLLGGMAGLALLLAAVGIYGVLSQLVAQRTREIGVRMALGATSGGVLALFLRQALWLVVAGIVAGLLGALGAARFLTSMLSGISATDPWVFAGAPLVLLLVALAAIIAPVWRAARVEPARALRME